jgi:3-phenylpropionate/trans-cinnamate dioxygenase ferredoxin reductase component
MPNQIVIVGAGQAAAQAVDVLRRKGHAGSLVVVGDEDALPYQRPPLSKKYLSGAMARDRLPIRHQAFYDEHRVELRLGRRATSLDRQARRLLLDDGSELAYDALLLATGSTPRRVATPGSALDGIHYLRTMADADRLRDAARPGARVVVVGGGYIGLEVAATCRELGVDVTVLEMADRVMNRVVCEPVSRYYEAEHRKHGVQIVLGARMLDFVGDARGRVAGVRCADGREYPADFAVVGVGVLADDALARAAGLHCDNGVAVDEYCRTSDPAIWAIGDCTSHPSLRYGYRVRLESVDNAFEQAGTAALDILGAPLAHDKVPWFWSDQYHHKLLIVGLSQGHDQWVLRGDPASHSFSAAYLRGGELIAIDTVNNAKDQMAARKLVAARVHPDPAKLADASIPLRETVTA